jgi:hypothetical protein
VRSIALGLCLALGCGGSPKSQAVKSAEVQCLERLGAELAAQLAAAAAAGSSTNKVAIALELSADELACAVSALGAKPAQGQ